MSLILDPKTNKILYRGEEIGEVSYKNGRTSIRFTLQYETDSDDAFIPVSYLAFGLSQIVENRSSSSDDLVIETDEHSIAAEFNVPRLLTEKIVKRGNYVWRFNKSDVDPWPSRLHGHDHDKGLKLDAISGRIYDTATRACCKELKSRELKAIQETLRQSRDFKDKVLALVDGVITGGEGSST